MKDFFSNLFKKATDFVAEQTQNIEKTLDGLRDSVQNFNEQNQNEEQKKQEGNPTKQIFENLNGATVKFLTPDGKFITSYTHSTAKTGTLCAYYDFKENELQILNVYYTNNKHEQVREISYQVVPYSYFTPAGFGNTHLGTTGTLYLEITTSVMEYRYVLGSSNIVEENYNSPSIYLTPDKNAGSEFLIIEEILKHLPTTCSETYHNTTAQRLEKSKEILDKNIFTTTIKKLAERPFTSVQEVIAKHGAPKFQSFTSKSGEVIPFKGDLIYWQPENSRENENRGFAHYIDLNGQLTYTCVIIENEKVDYIRVETTPFDCLRGNPHTGHCEVSISTEGSNYLKLRSGISKYMKDCSYTNPDSNEEEDKYISTQEEMSLPTHSLEDIYTLASRISLVIDEYNGGLIQEYILQCKNGTFVKQEQVQEEENEDFDNSYSNDSSSSSGNSSNERTEKKKEEKSSTPKPAGKAKNISIKMKNDTNDEVTVYNQGSGGSYRLQKNIITTIKMDEDDKLFEYNGGKKGRLLLVAEPNMDGKVNLISKL